MKKFQVTVNGSVYEVEVQEVGGDFVASPVAPVTQKVVVPVAQKAVVPVAISANAVKVVAPMPGKIIDVKVKVGQTIKEGDLIAVLEAMKMENEIFSAQGGIIASVNVTAGAMVESNDVIVTIN